MVDVQYIVLFKLYIYFKCGINVQWGLLQPSAVKKWRSYQLISIVTWLNLTIVKYFENFQQIVGSAYQCCNFPSTKAAEISSWCLLSPYFAGIYLSEEFGLKKIFLKFNLKNSKEATESIKIFCWKFWSDAFNRWLKKMLRNVAWVMI